MKTKTIIKVGIFIILIIVGFAEPTAEIFPFQLLAWAGLVGMIAREKNYANQS